MTALHFTTRLTHGTQLRSYRLALYMDILYTLHKRKRGLIGTSLIIWRPREAAIRVITGSTLKHINTAPKESPKSAKRCLKRAYLGLG